MGQTLTHGVYLPDEGERNCYSGLAGNWQILDTSVGTIAEHTTALAGKAPAVHTHTKSDITDFPAYGNAAGTICEGNDSRLSDARTPVAHTHTKSDVTDLLNSNFIPSANNSYDLGSSSYQWNNLYAKNYYYNGTEFQRKFVTLDSVQTITGEKTFGRNILLKNYNYSRGTIPSTNQYSSLIFTDNSNNESARLLRWFNADGYNGITLQSWDAQLTTDISERFQLQYDPSGNGQAVLGGNNFKEFVPLTNNSIDLGTSTNKWKTLNGINPGALSLPDLSVSQNVDTTGWTFNGTTVNSVLLNSGDTNVTKNGWLYIRTNSTVSGDRIGVRLSNTAAEYPTTIAGEIGFGHIEVFVPIVAGYKAYVFTNKAPTYIKFYPCLGNVPSGV